MGNWHFRGHPHYLSQQVAALGISPILIDRARHNKEIQRVTQILCQLAEHYRKARRGENGEPTFGDRELQSVAGSLEECERETFKLHALAAAAAQMVDEAYAAFGIEQPRRPVKVDSASTVQFHTSNGGDRDSAAAKPKAKAR
jgi:hypothetical protein